MVSGFEPRHFQIAHLLPRRDILRADRSLEFYQLDVEIMSFVTPKRTSSHAIEPVAARRLRGIRRQGKTSAALSARCAFSCRSHLIAKYGSGQARTCATPIEMADVSDHFRGGSYGLFARILEDNKENAVWGIPAPRAARAPSATG